MSQMDQITRLAASRDRLRAEAAALDQIIRQMMIEDRATQAALARFELGHVWGATKLGLHLGVNRNTAHKMMKTKMAPLAWEDSEGRLRVNASDVETWLAGKTCAARARNGDREPGRDAA